MEHSRPALPPASPPRVLVVDDSSVMRRVVGLILQENFGALITEAHSAKLAWKKIDQSRFDLIISDWNMPGQKGIDLLRQVREDGRFNTLPFVMLTAEGLDSFVARARDLGVNEYLLKPFTGEQLRDTVRRVLGLAETGPARIRSGGT